MNKTVSLLTPPLWNYLNRVLIFGPISFLKMKINTLMKRVWNIHLKVIFCLCSLNRKIYSRNSTTTR